MGNDNRKFQLQNALSALQQMKTAIESATSANPPSAPKADMVAHSYWKNTIKEYNLHRLTSGAQLPTMHPLTPPTQSFLVTKQSVLPIASSSNLKGCLTLADITAYISELEGILSVQSKPTVTHSPILEEQEQKQKEGNVELVDVSLSSPKSNSDSVKNLEAVSDGLMPLQPPRAYIALTLFETDVADIVISGASDTSPELILETDDKEKNVFASVHMCSALGLIFCNFAAHALSVSGLHDHPARYGSFVCAVVGFSAFMIFCMMQYLSGNYNDSLGFLPSCLMPSPTSCLKKLYCPQTKPETYGKCSKKALALCFIIMESVAFLSIVISTPIEAILLSYYN